jgi:16S rRNA (adenine1518-N6/adenine1519-N6)-dimethyltransferase
VIDPADPKQLETLLRKHRIDPKRSWGQNFLIDTAIRDRVADAASLRAEDEVLEVGAGTGALTIALAKRCRKVVAVELDRDLIPALHDVVAGYGNVDVVESDILKVDIASRFTHGAYVVAGNIPYQLTGALIRKLLDDEPRPTRLSLVVQKEVAERWTAVTGASLSTVAVQVFAEPRLLFTIPASAFEPQPRVDSACIVLEVRETPAVAISDLGSFFDFVESVFQFRRKQLGGAVGRVSGQGSSAAAARLRDIGIDPSRRPQTLSLAEWESLYTTFGGRPAK